MCQKKNLQMFCPRLSENFLFRFYFFKNDHSKNDQFLVEKSKSPAAIGTTFSPKFAVDAEVQNSSFLNTSYLNLCCNYVAVNINLQSECVF